MKILVLIDGSMWSHKAAMHALNVAKRKKAEVVLLSVLDKKEARAMAFNFCVQSNMCHMIKDHEEKFWRDMKRSINEEVAELLYYYNSNEVECVSKVIEGRRKETIVEETNRGGYSLVVMGAYGKDPKTEIGSLCTIIAREIIPPLLIVH